MITLLFTASANPLSKIIRFLTRSEYSHVEMFVTPMTTISSTFKDGVRVVPLTAVLQGVSKYCIATIDAPESAIDLALSQNGKPYDYMAIFGFFSTRQWQLADSWYCSELVAWALERAGKRLFNAGQWKVSPQDLINHSSVKIGESYEL